MPRGTKSAKNALKIGNWPQYMLKKPYTECQMIWAIIRVEMIIFIHCDHFTQKIPPDVPTIPRLIKIKD